MSFKVVTTTEFPQTAFQYFPQEALDENAFDDFPILGGILSDLKHLWHAKGPCLEIRNVGTGRKVGSWTFGGVLRDSNTKIFAVKELKRTQGMAPLLVLALNCSLSGGLICVFDIFGSKVLRVVQIGEQITNLHVIDAACDVAVLTETSPLKYFDGIVGIGTLGGNVFLLDLCKQICENAIQNMDISVRDEVNPCPMVILKKEKVGNIKKYVERSMDREEHLAIHLNVILNPSTEHFTLKGENGEDRVHVNRSEVEISALFYSPQLASLLVGYNFGSFQMWDLRSLDLLYTSPICEDHIPVTHFTAQEPADDPKAYCYIWVSYSHNLLFHSGLPFAVMYSFYFDNKKFVKGYGNLYEHFQHCSIRFQLELGDTQASTCKSRLKGGTCLGMQSINKCPTSKDLNSLALCLISWLIWDSDREVNTALLVFDLNQWYKEQLPGMPNWSNCSNYIIKNSLSEHLLDIQLDQKSLSQFMGIQRLEEHFCPTSLSFDLWGINEDTIFKIHNKGIQKSFLDKMANDSHLALVKPEDYSEQIIALGLMPLFCDLQSSNSLDIDYQRELLLSVALEQKLIGWLCQAAIKLANNAYSSSGLTIYNLLNWAFQRAVALKNACDNYCVPLFDYSGMRLDDNTVTLIACGTNQIRNLCNFYRYVSGKLLSFVSDKEGLLGEQKSLENVVVYFEVLLWMVNIGLLPEYQPRTNAGSLLNAPYLVHDLTQHYNKKRARLQMASRETFVEKDCLLFIDNMINQKGASEILRQQWQEDGGSGLYPPPSLQSVLRTYILDGTDLVFKHSLVTYTLLDIAMTVDEQNKVIKLLLKFPQIFDLTQSNIKIVQAFWHLDHDDYETALETIMDPCVLPEDLQHWHHSLMMRSLLLQEQSGLALLYLQIRKPSMQGEKDLLTVLSLLISKNMLDEAFKFRLQHKGPNDETLLAHIFNECNKNELLHTLLYRRMNGREEKAFFKHLQETRNPRCEDLKVFYYILRSRFLEAFDSYAMTKRRQPDTQGLEGQRDATVADNVVKMFKALLPDVNRNLVELVRKERTNLWKEMEKPTPLSVFVHSAKDQVRYKSSVIFAALAKVKETFNVTLNDTQSRQEVVTEDTPFLRTPSVYRNTASMDTPLLESKIIEQSEHEEFGPSPCKKLKLSPRTSKTSPVKSRNLSTSSFSSRLGTPIVKRKRQPHEIGDSSAVLPQSILKSVSRTILDDSVFDENTSVNTSLQMECENSIRRSRLGLTPRKAVRTPLKSHVKFDDLRYSGSSTEQSSKTESPLLNVTENLSKRLDDSAGSVTDDVFYSPDHSFEVKVADKSTAKQASPSKSVSLPTEISIFDESAKIVDKTPRLVEETKDVAQSKIPVEENNLSTNRMSFQSPKSRKSYKRSFIESGLGVRSSPRLARRTLDNQPVKDNSATDTTNSESPVPKPQKPRGRKSLSRSLLEHNAFAALKSDGLPEGAKPFGRRDELNTSTSNDTSTDMDLDDTCDASLEAFLERYKRKTFDTSADTVDSEAGEVVSRTNEFISLETRRESLRRANTGTLVSSNESIEEHRSKTVEVFNEENPEIASKNEHTNDPDKDEKYSLRPVREDETSNSEEEIIIKPKQKEDFLNKPIENVDNTTQSPEKCESPIALDKNEESADNHDDVSLGIDSPIKSIDTNHYEPSINVYEDLSSASEDVKEVLQNLNENQKVYEDISCSTSLYQSEKKDSEMPDHIMDSGESNTSTIDMNVRKSHLSEAIYHEEDVEMHEHLSEDPPETEMAFLNTGEVIEIESSSEESSKSDSYSENSSYSSNESVRGSEVSSLASINIAFHGKIFNKTEEGDVGSVEADSESDKNDSSDEHDGETRMPMKEFRPEPLGSPLRVIKEDSPKESPILIESDEEHMDSLLLEDQEHEPKPQDVSETVPHGAVEVSKRSVSLQCTLTAPHTSVNDSLLVEAGEGPEQELNLQEIVTKEAEEVLKHSVSLQCTLAAHQPSANDSLLLEPQEDQEHKSNLQETSEIVFNEAGEFLKRSVSLQCTLTNPHTSAKDNLPLEAGEEQEQELNLQEIVTNEAEEVLKHSVSSLCTLADPHTSVKDNLLLEAREEEKQGPNLQETPEKITNKAGEVLKYSVSSQCTLGAHDTSVIENDSPLVLRTIKKTYPARKGSSSVNDIDDIPQLAVGLIRRTYSRRSSGTKLFDKEGGDCGDQKETIAEVKGVSPLDDAQQQVPEGVEETKLQQQDLIETCSEVILESVQESEPPPERVSLESNDADIIGVEEISVKENEEVTVLENVKIRMEPDSTEETKVSPEPQRSKPEESASVEEPSEKLATKEDAVQENQDLKAEEEKEPPKAPIMTRRRSMLLSQKDSPTSSSVTDESVVSRGIKSSRSASQTDFAPSEASTAQSSASRSSQSSGSKRSSKRLLSETMFDKTVLADTPDKRDVMDTSIITQEAPKEAATRKRGSRKLFEDVDLQFANDSESSQNKGKRLSKTLAGTIQRHSRRTRSVSVDETDVTSTRKRSVRSKSIDLDDLQVTRSDGKLDLRVTLTSISEIPGPSTSKEEQSVSKSRSKPSSHFGDYTTSRRLTRRQASMLEAIGNVEQELKTLPNLENIEPLHLLDKPEFDGQPDPDEAKMYERSSLSNSSETLSRHTRSTSVLSDAVGSITPTKKRVGKGKVVSSASGIKSRLRRPSADTVSVTSDSPSPPKKSRKKQNDNEQDAEGEGSPAKTRTRAGSVSSTKSDASSRTGTTARAKRSRRINSAKSELPEIQEEKKMEEGESISQSAGNKRGRKKKE